ncbi:glycosyltransferase family 4 protein [Planococcus shenhongbingii]|uniref:glycosyltransferase family 4 protein n=1 Tax=Planococcus shenhongbingii TaxID=3058398 RepID=UPI00261E0935|nr:glycosyltransferase family 4 protein [Planococcus sp. N016]WKA58395.1 glycosyltransferase family 4 protein [Planococcus sp. N016]
MKIILAAPNFPQPRGNTVTVRRIAAHLEKLGVQTEIVSTTEEVKPLPFGDLVHGFHTFYFYQFMQKLAERPDPYIVTMTGTDLNVDLFHPQKRGGVLSVLREAKAIHVFDEAAKTILLKEAPEFEYKVFPIAQGATGFPPSGLPLEKEAGTFLYVLPAGIRKVKNIPSAISALGKLHKKYPHLRLWLVGPVIEEAEAEIVLDLVERHSGWVCCIGELPHSEMGAVYQQADAVLNTSLSEGQPAAILEAMSYGLPVLVSNVQGNSGMVENGSTGYLYNDEQEFLDYAEQLINDDEARQRLGQRAKQYAAEQHSSIREAEALLKIYKSLLQ